MRWSDIKRINGFSTPFVGVQWTPPANQRDLASRILTEKTIAKLVAYATK